MGVLLIGCTWVSCVSVFRMEVRSICGNFWPLHATRPFLGHLSGPLLGSVVPTSLSRLVLSRSWPQVPVKQLGCMKLGRCAIRGEEGKKKKITKAGLTSEGHLQAEGFNKLLPHLLICKASSRIPVSYQLCQLCGPRFQGCCKDQVGQYL